MESLQTRLQNRGEKRERPSEEPVEEEDVHKKLKRLQDEMARLSKVQDASGIRCTVCRERLSYGHTFKHLTVEGKEDHMCTSLQPFCDVCMEEHMRRKNTCPICRRRILSVETDQVLTNTALSVNLQMCDKEGCEEVYPLGAPETAHPCKWRARQPVRCDNHVKGTRAEYGCTFTAIPAEMEAHARVCEFSKLTLALSSREVPDTDTDASMSLENALARSSRTRLENAVKLCANGLKGRKGGPRAGKDLAKKIFELTLVVNEEQATGNGRNRQFQWSREVLDNFVQGFRSETLRLMDLYHPNPDDDAAVGY